MNLPDEVLVKKILTTTGDLSAFDELVRRYERKIYGLAYQFMGNHADAGDLAQDTFIRMYQALGTFRGEASFSTWLYRIAANICRDELRKQQRRKVVSLEDTPEIFPAAIPTTQSYCSPEEAFAQRELQSMVQSCMNELSDGHRLILVLREINGLSYEEISQVLQCSMGTVKSRISRARNLLKDKIEKKGELLSSDYRLNQKGGKQNALP